MSDRRSCREYLVLHEARISNNFDKQNEVIEDMKNYDVRYVIFADGFTTSQLQNLTYDNGDLIIAPIIFNYIIDNYSHEITVGDFWKQQVYKIND